MNTFQASKKRGIVVIRYGGLVRVAVLGRVANSLACLRPCWSDLRPFRFVMDVVTTVRQCLATWSKGGDIEW